MLSELNEIRDKALQLPEKERCFLAETLLQSIGNNCLTEIDEAWVEEAERRYNDYLQGKRKGISGNNIFSDIKQELGWKD